MLELFINNVLTVGVATASAYLFSAEEDKRLHAYITFWGLVWLSMLFWLVVLIFRSLLS